MTWTVLVGRPLHDAAHEVLDEFATVVVAETDEAIDAEIDRADAVITGGVDLPAGRIEAASQLKVITAPGVGLDNVDVGAATEGGVIVCNNPGANTRAVAEYTIAAVGALRRRLHLADRDVRTGDWEKYGYLAPELHDGTMGVLGYGAIGRLVCELASGLGMSAVAYDPYVPAESFADGVERVGDVPSLFGVASAVGIHAPLTDETRGLVDAAAIEALGPDGILVNAARGPIVDTDALVDALAVDAIWGAAVDVFATEPAPPDHPLFEFETVLVSPHMAGSTRVSVPAKDRGAAENVRAVYDRRVPDATVNRDALCVGAAYDGRNAGDTPDIDPF